MGGTFTYSSPMPCLARNPQSLLPASSVRDTSSLAGGMHGQGQWTSQGPHPVPCISSVSRIVQVQSLLHPFQGWWIYAPAYTFQVESWLSQHQAQCGCSPVECTAQILPIALLKLLLLLFNYFAKK